MKKIMIFMALLMCLSFTQQADCQNVAQYSFAKNTKPIQLITGKDGKLYSCQESIEAYHAATVAYWYATSDAERQTAWGSVRYAPNPVEFEDYESVAESYLADKADGGLMCGVTLVGCSVSFWKCYRDYPNFPGFESCMAYFYGCMGSCYPKNPIPIEPSPAPTVLAKAAHSIEDAIDIYWTALVQYYWATTQQEQDDAYALIDGVSNPLSYDDPEFNSKVSTYLSGKVAPGCLATTVVCYSNFLNCVALQGNTSQGFSFCVYGFGACQQRNGCSIPNL